MWSRASSRVWGQALGGPLPQTDAAAGHLSEHCACRSMLDWHSVRHSGRAAATAVKDDAGRAVGPALAQYLMEPTVTSKASALFSQVFWSFPGSVTFQSVRGLCTMY